MPKLVIVESPAKARTIERYLGKGYKVMSSMGHVRDLPSSTMGVDVEQRFKPTYRILQGKQKTVTALKKAAEKADEVFLATDLDREGEAIAWHLMNAMKLPKTKTRRVIFNEITKTAVQAAFAHPRDIDENMVNAQQARRILDRIVGYELSPLLWRKVARGLSAGRVQSVAVRLVVEREYEIEQFVAKEYWEIDAELKPRPDAPDFGQSFHAKLIKLDEKKLALNNKEQSESLVEELKGENFVIQKLRERMKKGNPSPPFITSRLQQTAWTQLRMSPRQTMRFAQQLYEGVEIGSEGSVGLITYMRTDSVRVSPQAIEECRDFIGKNYGEKYLPAKARNFSQSGRTQAAHEAIRPTSAARTPEQMRPYLDDKQFKLYDLIWRQFVGSQMAVSERLVTEVEIQAGRALFSSRGARLTFDGHEKVTGIRSDENILPRLEDGQSLDLVKLDPSQHFTQPPPRYTEGSLVRALERLGIGRPSTYAPIIATIQERGYVRQEQRKLFATELGKMVTERLVAHFDDLLNVKFTSHMEDDLDKVESGGEDWRNLLDSFYQPFKKDLEKAMEDMDRVSGKETDEKCEKCEKPMLIRNGKFGLFLGCSGYPECKTTRPLEQQPAAEGEVKAEGDAEQPEEKCPNCGKPLVMRSSKRGKFLGCSGYPECKHIKPLDGKQRQPAQETDIECDKCGAKMVIRMSRRGRFLGCSTFPKCKNTKPLPDEMKTQAESDANADKKEAE